MGGKKKNQVAIDRGFNLPTDITLNRKDTLVSKSSNGKGITVR